MTCICCKMRIKKADNIVRLSKGDMDYKTHHECWKNLAANRSEEQTLQAVKNLIEDFENQK